MSAGARAAAGPFARHAVAAAHPLAAEAGRDVLRAGGNALDAAIAVQFVLGVVEPQSSGIGGGGFLLWWDGSALHAWDGRETAPAGAGPDLFLQPDGAAMPLTLAQRSGLAVGVPGLVPMLHAAHRAHGRLPWAALVAPARRLAAEGFAISPRLHALIAADAAALRDDAIAAALYFGADGQPLPVGAWLRNPALAAVLARVEAEGAAALQRGAAANDIAARAQRHPARPGRLSVTDLGAFVPLRREPLCADWRERWRVCGLPPPSSGQIALMQMLALLDRATPAAASVGPGTLGRATWPRADGAAALHPFLHRYAEASRLAFADRAQHVADPAFVAAPAGGWQALLAPAYLARRAALIGPRALPEAAAGDPAAAGSAAGHGGAGAAAGQRWAPMPEQPAVGTTHLSVADAAGGVAALTSSIEAMFGARLFSDGGTGLSGGFPLNNQLTDFALAPADATGRPVANRVEPGKRPRSSMSPTLVFDRATGQPVLALGSALGPVIIHAVARSLLAWDDGLDLAQAFALPTVAHLGGPLLLEAGRFDAATTAALRALGHAVVEVPLPTGLHGLQRTPAGWLGAADPRREGVALGD